MSDAQERLRLKFESETDIIINEKTKAWEKYALWLENAAIDRLKEQTIKENNHLRGKIQLCLDILDDALTARISE